MDRFNWPYHNNDSYYNPVYQEDGQHTFHPETGQTSGGGAASGASWSYPGQSYQDFNVQPQIPFSPGPDWESALRTPQPMAMEDVLHSPIPQRDGQYSSQPETGQTSAGGAASEPWWSQPTPGQLQPYQDFNFPAQIPPSFGSDLEYLQPSHQPMVLADSVQNDASLAPSNPQPAAAPGCRPPRAKGRPPAKERFLAGLEAFARGVDLKDCSPTLRFNDYIRNDGTMILRGIGLYRQLTDEQKTLLQEAIIARQNVRPEVPSPAKERFLAGLEAFAQGVALADCSSTLRFSEYIKNDGSLVRKGIPLYNNQLTDAEKTLLREAVIARQNVRPEVIVDDHFLAGLDNYVQGAKLKDCSATISFGNYVSDNGYLHRQGRALLDRLTQADQERVNDALLSRRQFYLNRAMENAPVDERFLAGFDNYVQGVSVLKCSETLQFGVYVSNDGRLHKRGRELFNRLPAEDQNRVNQALATRRKKAAEQISGDLPYFYTALEPYSNGLDLQACSNQRGLSQEERHQKVERYLTPEGGLTVKGQLLIENLSPDEQLEVWKKVEARRQHINPSAQVPELSWPLPEIPALMPEQGGMDPTAMVDPIQTETTVDPMQTEAMWATVWQYTGQAMPGTWAIPSESTEPPIPSYNNEAFGADFQHLYGPHADQYPG
ncbi:MAG: hypothetical protein P8X89_20475 [Reinekea sp.]